jgi:hypothetical protein
VQSLTPPIRIINLPPTANIAVVAALNDEYRIEAREVSDTFTITTVATAMAIKDNLEKSPKYNSYIFPVYTIATDGNGLTDENIMDMKDNANADYLIFVEKFQFAITKLRVKTTKSNCVRIMTPHSVLIKIYDIAQNSVIDEKLIVDTLTIQVNADPWETEDELMERLPDNTAAVLLVIKKMAKDYVEEIAPFWKEETRFYYVTPDGNVEQYIDNEEWDKAMNVWMKYVNDANRKIAAVSCFNMAVGCEMMGEYELALQWMENIKRKDATFYWDEYKKLLEKRLSEKAILDKIMN